jgi:hypothetical protein
MVGIRGMWRFVRVSNSGREEEKSTTEQETETGQKQAHELKTDCGVVDLPSEAIHCDERSIDVR